MTSTSSSDARISLLFEKFSDFVEGYASNLSMGGMFLATVEQRPVGSVVDFEIKLTDGFQLVQGLGEVVWALPADGMAPEDGSRPLSGLAMRFQSLDDRGRELILKIMEEQLKSGGEPFDVDAVPAGAVVASAEAPPVAEVASVAPPPEALGGEPKILGEDGFTLIDADAPQTSPGTIRPQLTFEELEFDAPWGERLPEIPQEVLEEGLEARITLPEPEPPAGDPPAALADEDLFEREGEAAAAAVELDQPPVFALSDEDATVGPLEGALEDSFSLAEEAAAELDLAPPVETGEPDFEDIDFSVPSAAEAEPTSLTEAGSTAAATDDAFALGGRGEPSSWQAVPLEEEDPTILGQRAARADFVDDDEDATLVTSEAAEVPESEEPLAVELQHTPARAAALVPAAPAAADLFELVPEAPAPVASAAEPAAAVQDYEDDLFTDVAGGGTGHILRQTLAGSGRSIGVAALVLALTGAGYLYRDAVRELLGLGRPRPGPPAASSPPVAGQAALPAAEPQPSESGQPESATPGSAPLEVEGTEGLSPPVIEVAVEEGTEVVPGTEREAASGELAAARAGAAAAGTEPAVVQPRPPTAQAAPPPPTPAPAASSIDSASPATRVDRITWRREEDGTLVTVELDGDLAEGRYVHSALTWAPDREMVEIKGIREPYVSGRIEVGSPEVRQMRIGHHLKPGGDVLRLVFDFPAAGPRVAEVRGRGDRLEILVRR